MVKWKQIKLGDCFDKIVGGGTPSRNIAGYWHGNIPWATVKDFNTFDSRHTQEYITADGLANSATHLIPKGTPITSTRMGLGRIVVYDIDVAINQDLRALFIKKGISSPFIVNWFIHNAKHIEELGTGSTVKGIRIEQLTELPISFPPLPEQRAIAAALSDVDGYIAALERLIAKKRNIKKGAMQELLTGKRRLPGFKGEWVEKKLGDMVSSARSGGTPLTSINSYYNGHIPFLSINDMTAQGKYLRYASNSISQIGLENSASWIVPVNSLIYSMYASVGFVSIAKIPMAISQAVLCLEFYEAYDSEFLYYLLNYIQPSIFKYVGEGTQKNLNAQAVKNFDLFTPATKAEQTAIAAILSDMDAEIDALTAKLAKVRNIKQGMMQELLTGRIRLVNETEKEGVTPALNAAAKVIPFKPKNTEAAKSIKNASTKVQKAVGHNTAIEDAVILAAVTERYATEQYPLAPFYAQKFPYLLHRHMEGLAKGYIKKAAGPYKPELKYRTALPIGLKNQYVVAHEATYQGKSFVNLTVGDNIVEEKNYFAQWHGDEPLKWLEQFRYIKNRRDELELLTTVDMAMVELRNAHKPITILAIKEIIKNSEEWKAKLKRELFSDDNIKRAVKWSNELFGTESKPQ